MQAILNLMLYCDCECLRCWCLSMKLQQSATLNISLLSEFCTIFTPRVRTNCDSARFAVGPTHFLMISFTRFARWHHGQTPIHWHCQLWGTGTRAPSTSNCLIFLITSEPHELWHSTPCGCLCSKNILFYSFVTVYCMNFLIFFVCHP